MFFHYKLIVIVCKFNFSCCSFLSDNFLNNSLDNTSFLIYSKVVYLWVKLPGINSKTRFFSKSRVLFLPCYSNFYIPLAIWATTLWSRFPWECSGTCFDSCLCKYPQYFVSVPMMMWVFTCYDLHPLSLGLTWCFDTLDFCRFPIPENFPTMLAFLLEHYMITALFGLIWTYLLLYI